MNQEEDFLNIGQHEDILRFVQRAPDDISWTIDQAEFDDLLALKKDSAPGPDGIPSVPTSVPGILVRNFSLMLTELFWKEAPFLTVLLKVEPSLSPRPLTSMTMEELFDLQTRFVH